MFETEQSIAQTAEPLCQPFASGCSQSVRDRVAGELVSPTPVPFCRPLAAQSSSFVQIVKLSGFVLYSIRLHFSDL